MDDKRQSAARLRLAKGFLGTVGVEDESTEHDIRNAFSRCYYSFFHLSHVLLGRYRPHDAVPKEVGKIDPEIGQFIEGLQKLRIEADYNPNVIEMEYKGSVDSYRLAALQVLDGSEIHFKRLLRLARANLNRRRSE